MATREHAIEDSRWTLRTALLIIALAALPACGLGGEERQDASAPTPSELESSPAVVATAPERSQVADSEGPEALYLKGVAGTYQVEGVTVQANRGRSRDVSGTIVLQAQGTGYTASFDLHTVYPTDTADIPAQIEGTGSGRLVGDRLVGTAETKMRPGAAVQLAGQGGAPHEDLIVVSSSIATVNEDRSLSIQIANEPGPGQVYSPSVTVLKGVRQDLASSLPAVSAAPKATGDE